jgi:hypothetical protein
MGTLYPIVCSVENSPSESLLTPLPFSTLRSTAKTFHAVLADVKSWMVLTPPQYYSLGHCHNLARENQVFV